jgi:hypothetical protein
MSRAVLWGALALNLIVVAISANAAKADQQSCAQFRDAIIRMETESVRPPGWFGLDRNLRELYTKDCLQNPGDALPPLHIALDGGPYTLSPDCDALLSRISGDPLLEDADAQERARWLDTMRSQCRDFLDALKRRTGIDPDKDPGGFWPAVGNLAFNGFAPPGTPSQAPASIYADPGWQRMCKGAATNQNTCLQRQQNMQSLAAPLIKNTVGPGSPGADNPPEPKVTPRSTDGHGTTQAGAFADCAALYGSVVNMCKANELTALRTAARMPPPAPPKAAPPKPAPPQQAAAKPNPPQASQAPPQQSAAAPSQCQQLAAKYVAAARANDGPGAIAGYNALKAAGGCGVLDKVPPVVAAAPAAGDPRFISRGARPGIDSTVGACNASPAECQEAMRQLEAGTSPAAKAALMANAISVGLQLGAAMANGLAAAAPQAGGGAGGVPTVRGNNTDYRSLAAPPIHNGRGQGSGTPQYNTPSTITGTTR